MAIALAHQIIGGAGPTATFGSPVTSGNFILAAFGMNGAAPTITGVTDNVVGSPNTYHQAIFRGSSLLAESVAIYYAWNVVGRSGLVVSAATSGGTFGLDCFEFSGVQTLSDPLDGVPTSFSAASTTNGPAAPIVTSQAGSLLISVIDFDTATPTHPTGWTSGTVTLDAWDIAGAAGSQSAQWNSPFPATFLQVFAAFKAPSLIPPVNQGSGMCIDSDYQWFDGDSF